MPLQPFEWNHYIHEPNKYPDSPSPMAIRLVKHKSMISVGLMVKAGTP
jgi:hypothetical protein